MEASVGEGHEQTGTDGGPDLRPRGVRRCAIERFDPQMLLDSLKQQPDLPPLFLEIGRCIGRGLEGIGEHERAFAAFETDKGHPTQRLGLGVSRSLAGPDGRLVGTRAGAVVHRSGVDRAKAQVPFGTENEVRGDTVAGAHTGKVQVRPVHGDDGVGVRRHHIQEANVVHLAVGQRDEGRDTAAQIQQGVVLDGRLGLVEMRPGTEREVQIDRRQIHSINGVGGVYRQRLAHIELPRHVDEMALEILVDPGITWRVNVARCGAGNAPTEAHVVELLPLRVDTALGVLQPLPTGEPGEHRAKELTPARAASDPRPAPISRNTPVKLAWRDLLDQLRQDTLPLAHRRSLSQSVGGGHPRSKRASNSSHEIRQCAVLPVDSKGSLRYRSA
jgi:hypothetical protein